VQIIKVPDDNTVQIQIDLSPNNLDAWNNVDFMQMIQIDAPVPISGYSVIRNPNGTVSITVQYAGNLHGLPLNVTVDPSLSGLPIFSMTQPITTVIPVIPDDNQEAYFYSPEVYKIAGVTGKLATAVSFLSVAMFVLGLISDKMIGVEMMAVIQVSFFSLVSLSQLNPCFSALASLWLVNGYNQMHRNHLQDALTPIPPKGIGMFSRFA